MSHWAVKYIGQPWTDDHRCYDWFRQIQREQFGRDMPVISVPPGQRDTLTAVRWMNGKSEYFGHWAPADVPVEGDGVFLSANGNTSHHIGIVIYPGQKMMILHALKSIGIVVSDRASLRSNNLQIMGFWTYNENTA